MNKVLVSQAQPIKGRLINQNLESDQSIEHFLDSNSMLQSSLQVFTFDKVLNDSHPSKRSLYASILKSDLQTLQTSEINLCTILFGPLDRSTDTSPKPSPLLSTKSNGDKNLVVKAFKDLLSCRHLGAPIRLQVFQVYKDEVMDLLVQDYSQLSEKVTVKRAGASGRVEVMC
jgi:hypothetical protein